MEQSSLTFFHIHVVHQAYKQRVQTELGILPHLLDKRLNETLSRESDYIVQEVFIPSSLFDATFTNFPKR